MIYHWSYYPSIDMHGEYTTTAYTVVTEFIRDAIRMKQEYIVIIHGKGTGKLKDEVHQILQNHSKVLEYNLDPENLGQTLVRLKIG